MNANPLSIAIAFVLLLAPSSLATDVTLRLVDQNGVEVSASQFVVAGTILVQQDGTVSLSPGTYSVRVLPGILGIAQGNLYRDESVTIGASFQAIDLMWGVAPLTATLVDQGGQPIAASQFDVFSSDLARFVGTVQSGNTLSLPVTEDPSSAPIQGSAANGYVLRPLPGLLGISQGGAIYRNDPPVELSQSGQNIAVTWHVAPLAVTLVDQGGQPIAASQFDVFSPDLARFVGTVQNGNTLSLPVTEDPSFAPIQGSLANGYLLRPLPGLLGISQGGVIYRNDPPVHLTSAGSNIAVTWKVAPMTATLVDQDGQPIPASQFDIFPPTHAIYIGGVHSGDSLTLPVTDDPSFSPTQGSLASGYALRALPGLFGIAQGGMIYRDFPAVALTATGGSLMFTWEVAHGRLHAVDAQEHEVAGSLIAETAFPSVSFTDTFVSMPVNDLGTYPDVRGSLAGAYSFSIKLFAGGNWEGPFNFALATGRVFNPLFVSIGGSNYGLRITQFTAPIANAGPDQTIHAGQIVHVDGSGSYDDNTASDLLTYAWTITSAPSGSTASLSDASTATPSFLADLPGIYQVALTVTDLDHLASQSDSVQISSVNLPPTANGGTDMGGVVCETITLDGSASSDPDHDSLTYAWTIVSKPKRSSATLASASTASPTLTPDVSGTYTIQLVVNDGFASSAPDPVVMTVVTPIRYAEALTLSVIQTSKTLPVSFFTNSGNKKSFESLLLSASHAMQEDELEDARKNLKDAIVRTDGWALRGRADPTGSGRDWVLDATTSATFYAALTAALDAIAADDCGCHQHDHEHDDD